MRAPASDRTRLALLALASVVLQLPFLGRGLSFLDEGSIVAIADALHHGERLYADRVTPLAPLTYELLAALYGVFGPSLAVGRWLQAAVLTACVLLAYGILRPLAGSRAASWGALAVLAVKALGFPLWTIVNYSQLALGFALAAVLCLVRAFASGRGAWLVAAGAAVGLTVATKQNLGALVAVLAAAAVAADAARRAPAPARATAAGWARLALGGVVPVAAVAAVFAARGTLGALYRRAVVGLTYLADPYFVPLPGPAPWAFDVAGLGRRLFAYFPSPVFDMVVEGALDPEDWPVWLGLEAAVKATYAAPLAALAAGAWLLVRDARRRPADAAWSGGFALVLFGALAYASMLYRADWSHLMNVYPALLLPTAWGLGRAARAGAAGRRVAAAAVVLWLGAGLLAGGAALWTYPEPVEAARGRVRGLPVQVGQLRLLLAWLGERPAAAPVALLRADPLVYFLADRRIPLAFDLLNPGYLTPEDDARVAERLRSIPHVVYNPKQIPTMPTPVTEYAPRTSRVLAREFRVERALTAAAFVLAAAPRPAEETAAELWERAPALGPAGNGLRPDTWLFWHVLAGGVAPGRRACAALPHAARAGETFVAVPLLDPDTWALSRPGTLGARFRVAARAADGERVPLYEEWVVPGPPHEVRIPLDAVAGEAAALVLCADQGDSAPGSRPPVRVAWAEPRVVRASAPLASGQRPSAAWAKAKR